MVKTSSRGFKLVLVIIVGFVLAFLTSFASYWFVPKTIEIPTEKVLPKKVLPGNILKRAPENKLIEGFYPELLVDADAKILDSVEGKSPNAEKQMLITFYETKKKLSELSDLYEAYFKEYGWTVRHKTVEDSQLYFFAVRHKSGESLNLTIVTIPDKAVNLVHLILNKVIR